ncbi:MAG: hypothetical protein SX243_03735 [Acidobacteriota bacterium]|nr:hypothetical protein [Acidobacteriota bacterium]
MSSATELHPLATVQARLVELAEERDSARLGRLLQGLGLPALGGNDPPAELLWQALTFPPAAPALPQQLALLTAELIEELPEVVAPNPPVADEVGEAAAIDTLPSTLAGPGTEIPEHRRESYAFNVLHFASLLPPEPRLFRALKETFQPGSTGIQLPLEDPSGQVTHQLRQALIVHQADPSLGSFWFALLEPSPNGSQASTAEDEARWMDGWMGLVWMPPTEKQLEAGVEVDMELLGSGLEALDTAVKGISEAVSILRWSIHQLNRAFPRSPEFWVEQLMPYRLWSLQRVTLWAVLLEQWPQLEELDVSSVSPVELEFS